MPLAQPVTQDNPLAALLQNPTLMQPMQNDQGDLAATPPPPAALPAAPGAPLGGPNPVANTQPPGAQPGQPTQSLPQGAPGAQTQPQPQSTGNPEWDRLVQENQLLQQQKKDARDKREQLNKILTDMQDPDYLQRQLQAQQTPQQLLKDRIYDQWQINQRNPIFGSLKGQPYEPVSVQRYNRLNQQAQQRMKIVMDQLGILNGEDQSLSQSITQNQLQRNQEQQRANDTAKTEVLKQNAAEKEKNDVLINTWRQAKLDLDRGVAGAKERYEKALLGLKSIANPFTAIASTLASEGKSLDDPETTRSIRDFVAQTSAAMAPTVTTSTPTEAGGTVSVKQKVMPGTSAPASVGAPLPTPTPKGQPILSDHQKLVQASLQRPFDPSTATDHLVQMIAQDSANEKLVSAKGPFDQVNNPSKAMINRRMAELGVEPNNATNSIRERALLAPATLAHMDEINGIIDQAAKQGDLGVLATRWNDLLTGKVGDDPTQGKIFSKLSTDLKLLTSNIAMMHGGVRAAASPQMIKDWADNLRAADPETMKSKLSAARTWVEGYGRLAGAGKQIAPATKSVADDLVNTYGGKK